MFRIGEFSKMSKTTVKTLHYYDEIGLLKPESTDQWTNYRLYTTGQLVKLHQIQSFRQMGLSITNIQHIMAGCDSKSILSERRDEILKELEERDRQLSQVEFILKGEKEMNYQATIKELPRCTVYSKRMVIPNYNAYFEILPALGESVKKKYPNLKCTVPEYCFVLYHDGEYKEKDIDVEYCEAVDKIMPGFDGIIFKEMDGVRVVSVLHKGPYGSLGKAYAFAFKWVEENGYTVSDKPRESYIDGVWNKENEDDWLTEVQIPIKTSGTL